MNTDEKDNRKLAAAARTMPARERWLYENRHAGEAVMRGIEQARKGQFATIAPDLKANAERLVASSG